MFTQNRASNFSAKADFLLRKDLIDTDPINYNIIEYTTPSSTLEAVVINRCGTTGVIPGDVITEEQSTVLKFIIDDELKVYFTLKEMQSNVAGLGMSEDILTVSIMNNYHKIIAKGVYKNMFIGNISELRYTTLENETTTYVDVTINFLGFKLEPLSKV